MKVRIVMSVCAATFAVAGCLHSGSGAGSRAEALAKADAACDLVIYGSTPAAIAAAIQAKRMGRSAVIVSPETRIGGLTTGGLGQTDIGNKAAFGGIALEFYKDVAAYYANDANWTRQKPESYFPDGQCAGSKGKESMWTFEPSAALKILEGWERRDGLDIRRGEWLDRERGVVKENGRIVSIKTLSDNVYRGKVFVDATYEGDLMAAAGVSYTVGREANAVYGETLNGNQPTQARFHQLNVGVDPHVVKGDPKSGLLFGVEPFNPNLKEGDGDKRVQAYCFRMCLTDDPGNRIPFKKPAGYDERDYELLFRHLAIAPLDHSGLPWINSKMPNRKTDTNNRTGFATDFIGQNWAWPEASYAEREKIRAAHLKYQRGLMWTFANHPRVPEKIRKEVSRWGTCKDEFADGLGDGWQTQLYVREARRMVGEYVMTEHNCRGKAVAPRPVAMGAYNMDSHHVRRYVGADGFVHNEGDVEVGRDANGKRFPPYPIDYGAVLPKRGECGNLIVPVCISASHIAFGSIRMEPVFFALGQVAGTAASIAASQGVAVHDVPYAELADCLKADGQVVGGAGAADDKDGLPPLPEGTFTYVVIPDTQLYYGEGTHVKEGKPKPTGPTTNPAFESRVNWIVDHLESERIFFVSHVGDIVDFKSPQQWTLASNIMSRLDGKVPYGISPGNHDIARDDSRQFNAYFPRSRYAKYGWYAGGFDGCRDEKGRRTVCAGNSDSCQLVEAGGVKFVFFHLECNAPAPVLKWVDSMLEKYADRKAIICTHMCVGYKTKAISDKHGKLGERPRPDDWFGVMDWSKCHGANGLSGEQMWDLCFSQHKNIILVVSGDQSGAISARETRKGVHGNTVHLTLQDYPRRNDDDDWLRLYRFHKDMSAIDVWTYSPRQKKVGENVRHKIGRAHHVFTLPLD